jgi:hypothetical protein
MNAITRLPPLPALALVLVATACGGDSTSPAPDDTGADTTTAAPCGTYLDEPVAASSVVHVSTACAGDAPDGSVEAPFATITEGLAAVEAGGAVLVDAGSNAESVTLDQDVSLLGDDVTLAPAEGVVGIYAGEVTAAVRGFRVEQADIAGAQVVGGSVTFEDCTFTGARVDANGLLGYGVVAMLGAHVGLLDSVVESSEGVGVVVVDATATMQGTTIRDNLGGGVRLEATTEAVHIADCELTGNSGYGLGLFSAYAIVVQNLIAQTGSLDGALGDGALGDGVIATELLTVDGAPLGASELDLSDGNEIRDNARVGVLLAGEVYGIVVQNLVAGNARAGLWLQDGAGLAGALSLEDNEVTGNAAVGIGLTTGAVAALTGNLVQGTTAATVPDTTEGSVTVGDGIVIYDGATATITGNTTSDNARAGLLLDAADHGALAISGNTVTGNEAYGIVVQNLDVIPDTSDNTLADNAEADLYAPHDPADTLPTAKAALGTAD